MPVIKNMDGAIQILFPEAVNGIDYILQQDDAVKGPYISEWNMGVPEPTELELVSAATMYKKHLASIAYKNKRQVEYPGVGDQLDAQWKALESLGLIPDETAPEDSPNKILSDIKSIKTKYPKPK